MHYERDKIYSHEDENRIGDVSLFALFVSSWKTKRRFWEMLLQLVVLMEVYSPGMSGSLAFKQIISHFRSKNFPKHVDLFPIGKQMDYFGKSENGIILQYSSKILKHH